LKPALAVLLLLGAPHARAKARATEAPTAEYYLKALRLESGVAAEIEKRGPVERIQFHPDGISPASEDFEKPENYSRKRLMQLMLIPKPAPGGIRSLADLRRAAERKLASSRAAHEFQQRQIDWPGGTFWVSISAPYQLLQCYTEDETNFLVLTTGLSPEVPYLSLAYKALSESLYGVLKQSRPRTQERRREPAKASVRLDKASWENVFEGHYGESLRFDADMAADVELRGAVEAVSFHYKTIDPVDLSAPAFEPKPSDYRPENFSRLRLMQLLVIPKSAQGANPLKALRQSREADLAASGAVFAIRDKGPGWPKDSFSVSISSPSRLLECYSESDREVFILTSGGETASDYPYKTLSASLRDYLSKFDRHAEENPLLQFFSLRFFAFWICLCASWLLFDLRLSRRIRWRRLRRAGRAALAFASASALLGALAFGLSWRLGADRWVHEYSILFLSASMLPWASRAASIFLGGRRPWRVFFWSAGINWLPAFLSFLMVLENFIGKGRTLYPDDSLTVLFLQAGLGAANGICFGLAHSGRRPSKDPFPSGPFGEKE
jgi:hypothetical protein